jgi:hypothetical protein
MNASTRSLLLLGTLLALPAALPGDEGPVARLGDKTFEREDFEDWIVERYGVVYLHQFLIESMVFEQAEERGLMPSADEVAARFEKEEARIVSVNFRGDRERWIADLDARGYSYEGWRQRRTSELRAEMAQAALVRARRAPDSDALEQRYRELYGDDGELVELQALYFSAYRGVGEDDDRPDLGALKQAARRRADEARDRWQAGADWDELLALSDPSGQEGVTEGRIEHYRKNMLGKAIQQAVTGLDRGGDITQPVDVFDGTWLLRLVERREVAFDDVRETLTEELLHQQETSGEMALIQSELLGQEGLEILLR